MIEYQNVILLKEKSSPREKLSQELIQNDFTVRCCGSVSELCQLHASSPAPVVVLVGAPHILSVYARQVREQVALPAIVALGFGVNVGWRVRIMTMGADACHDIYTDIRELAAILGAWGRHAGFAMNVSNWTIPTDHKATASATWRLSANGRVLVSPHGCSLPLTSLESGFLRRLALSEGHLLYRNDKSPGEDARCATLETRNMDVLVSRLRRKARYAEIPLPLLAVRGCGYVFAEGLNMPATAIPS